MEQAIQTTKALPTVYVLEVPFPDKATGLFKLAPFHLHALMTNGIAGGGGGTYIGRSYLIFLVKNLRCVAMTIDPQLVLIPHISQSTVAAVPLIVLTTIDQLPEAGTTLAEVVVPNGNTNGSAPAPINTLDAAVTG